MTAQPDFLTKDRNDADVALKAPNIGSQPNADSRSVAPSTETFTALALISTKLEEMKGMVDGLEGFTDQLEAKVDACTAAVADLGTKIDTLNTNVASPNPSAVYGAGKISDVAYSCDTSALAAGDVIADTQVITGAFLATDATGTLASCTFTCEDDLAPEFTAYFFADNVVLGTENSTPSLTDANSRVLMGKIKVVAADWIDLGGVRTALPDFKPFGVRAKTGTADLYTGLVLDTGTPTLTVNGLRGHPFIQWG